MKIIQTNNSIIYYPDEDKLLIIKGEKTPFTKIVLKKDSKKVVEEIEYGN